MKEAEDVLGASEWDCGDEAGEEGEDMAQTGERERRVKPVYSGSGSVRPNVCWPYFGAKRSTACGLGTLTTP